MIDKSSLQIRFPPRNKLSDEQIPTIKTLSSKPSNRLQEHAPTPRMTQATQSAQGAILSPKEKRKITRWRGRALELLALTMLMLSWPCVVVADVKSREGDSASLVVPLVASEPDMRGRASRGDPIVDGDNTDTITAPEPTPQQLPTQTPRTRTQIWTVREPAQRRTRQPTESPTSSPSPSFSPTVLPTDAPSSLHTDAPSSLPTLSSRPTAAPSDTPTRLPSSTPTSSPSKTTGPSDEPTAVPTDSKNPTATPTDAPSDSSAPSEFPSITPTESISPSSLPSTFPTQTPEPSDQPTSSPTETASDVRTVAPTEAPSSLPSESNVPTRIPSFQPSDTSMASQAPSAALTEDIPVRIPEPENQTEGSLPPSEMPSEMPSEAPSEMPSEAPSEMPSIEQSSEPSHGLPTPCPEGLFGPYCSPPPIILSISPENAFTGGGTVIQVSGVNLDFPNRYSTYGCYFSAAGHVGAALISTGVIECIAPSVSEQHPGLSSSVLQIYVDGVASNEVPFAYSEGCQGGSCGSGFCSFGQCNCPTGFRGDQCEDELVSPVIIAPPSFLEIHESENFELRMEVSAGTLPVEWSIVGDVPAGLSIDSASGLLLWRDSPASSESVQVLVKAQNIISSATVELNYIVLPSYSVTVSTPTLSLSLPAPSIVFEVQTREESSGELIGGKVAHVWVRRQSDDQFRRVETVTDADGFAVVEYLPYSKDKGNYVYGGTHPAYMDYSEQGEFNIRAIEVSPSSYTVFGRVDEQIVLEDVFFFELTGGDFTGLSVHFDARVIPDTATVELSLGQDAGTESSNVSLLVSVESSRALYEGLLVTLISDQGDSISFDLVLDIRERSPVLKVTPSTVDIYVPEGGGVSYKDIVVENVGSYSSDDIEIELPHHPILYSLSGSGMPGLDVDESGVVTFAFGAYGHAEVESPLYGAITFRAGSVVELMHYRVIVVPNVEAALTVIAQNEATFFSEEKLNVSGADVRVRRTSDGVSWSGETNDAGVATFQELTEGVYDVEVRKQGHREYRSSLILSAPGRTFLAFLQAEVVSHTYAIIPIDDKENYLVETETSLNTFVPKPAVVWNPARPDWEGIRARKVEKIQMTATNVGTTLAENVTISWPGYWENIEFIFAGVERSEEDKLLRLGNLPANSSYTITILVNHLPPTALSPEERSYPAYNGIFIEPVQRSPNQAFDIVYVPSSSPVEGRINIHFNEFSLVDSVFDEGSSKLYRLIYNGIQVVGVDITENALPTTVEQSSSESYSSPPTSRSHSMECARQFIYEDMCSLPEIDFEFCGPTKGTQAFKGFYEYMSGARRTVEHDFVGEATLLSPASHEIFGYKLLDCSSEGVEDRLIRQRRAEFLESGAVRRGCRMREAPHDPIERVGHESNRRLEALGNDCSEAAMYSAYDEIVLKRDLLIVAENRLHRCIDESDTGRKQNIFLCAMAESVSILPILPRINQVVECQLEQQLNSDVQNEATQLQSLIDLLLLPYNGMLLDTYDFSLPDDMSKSDAFDLALKAGSADDSEGGRTFSLDEMGELLQIALGVPGTADIAKFVQIWNQSLLSWIQGVYRSEDLPREYPGDFFDIEIASELLLVFESNRGSVKADGFHGLTDAWIKGVQQSRIDRARFLADVCASVNLRVEEGVVLIDKGFEVKLDLSNEGVSSLNDLSVSLQISQTGTGLEASTSRFLVETTNLYNISMIDGSGTLEGSSTAQVSWVLVPSPEAAPQSATSYNILVVLMYSVDGEQYEDSVSSASIVVTREPQIHPIYFQSRAVIGDDPFTSFVEPSLPFQLGILVGNSGRDEAEKVEIVMSRPEILTENGVVQTEFSIVRSQMGSIASSKSLGVDFGALPGRGKAAAVWDLVSLSRAGLFNFSGVLQFQRGAGDDRHAFIESKETYELSHIVRIVGEHPSVPRDRIYYYDDGIGDFLVNLHPDSDFLPDTVFPSDKLQSNFSVGQVIDEAWWEEPVWDAGDDSYEVLIQHESSAGIATDWNYIRFEDPMAGTDYVLESATRSDWSYTLFPRFNAWQTSGVEHLPGGASRTRNHIHLFDYGVSTQYSLSYRRQYPVADLQITEITQQSVKVAWDRAPEATAYYVVIKPTTLSDEYSRAASSFTQATELSIPDLSPGTSFQITVYAGYHEVFEKTGAVIVANTLGSSNCGSSFVEWEGGCIESAVGSISGTSEPTFAPPTASPSAAATDAINTSPTSSSAPTSVSDMIEFCPVEDLCNDGNQKRYWISKFSNAGNCKTRCVKENKFFKFEGFVCGQTCGVDAGDVESTPPPTATPNETPPTEGEGCPSSEACIVDMFGTPGYHMSYYVAGRTCSIRCMRWSLVEHAKERGYMCGPNCGEDVSEFRAEEADMPRTPPSSVSKPNDFRGDGVWIERNPHGI